MAVHSSDHRAPLSAVLPVRNEEHRIFRTLKDLQWVDEVVVVDMFSSDDTVAISRTFPNVSVFQSDGGPNRLIRENMLFGLLHARNDWVLFTATDELLSPRLVSSIRRAVQTTEFAGFYLWYEHYFSGWPIRHVGWDLWLPHLVRRSRCELKPKGNVHENPFVPIGPLGYLQGVVEHHSHPSIHTFISKMNRYTSQDAAIGVQPAVDRVASFLRKVRPELLLTYITLREFGRLYLWHQGFRDGVPGFLISALKSFYDFTLEAKYWEAAHRLPTPVEDADHERERRSAQQRSSDAV
jgi:hypothetical protein